MLKKIRSYDNILYPDKYTDIISEYGTIIEPGTDCMVADFRGADQTVIKSTAALHFKISECIHTHIHSYAYFPIGVAIPSLKEKKN